MTPIVYGIPNCDTVKKARAWLTAQGVAYEFRDFKKDGVPAARLDRWIAELGWDKLINRKGTTWRKLPADVQAGVTDAASAKRLMMENVSVIRRPIVEWGKMHASVGFDAAEWMKRLT